MKSIYQRNTHFPIENVFNIEQPEQYSCFIGQYQASLSSLKVEVATTEQGFQVVYTIGFTGVMYLAGPTRWKGANFCVESPDKCIELVQGIEQYKDFSPDDVLDSLVLYTLAPQGRGHPVSILTQAAHIFDNTGK